MKDRLINLAITVALCCAFAYAGSYIVSSIYNNIGWFGSNFPSHHVLYAFCVALSMLFFSKRIGVIFLVLALVIAIWRVVGGYHSIFEVIGGFIMACISISMVVFSYILLKKERMLE
jgi:membrane-associated phospholipid phosphatase